MARPRSQKGGWVKSRSTWTVQYREYDAEGNWGWRYEYLGAKKDMGVREAERKRREFMAAINLRNCRPSSSTTLSEFWASRFEPQVVWRLKKAGRTHYATRWRMLEPLIGGCRLSDVDAGTIEGVVRQLFERGYSVQTVVHAKHCLSAIFEHARRLRLYQAENPARLVSLPAVRHERRPTYTVEQLRLVLSRLTPPAREMALLSVATSMGPAELCGLRLRNCNFTPQPVQVDGIMVAPYSVAVRENYYRGEYGSLKTSSRERIEGLTPELAAMLAALVQRSKRQDPEAPLFQSRRGTPVDSHNIANRQFRKLADTLGFPVTWYGFRRAHSALAGQIPGIPLEDRQRTMGHRDASMTLYYSVQDVERRRAIPEAILGELGWFCGAFDTCEEDSDGQVQSIQ